MRVLALILLCLSPYLAAYQVSFEGEMTQEIFLTIQEVSQLESDRERPPPTLFTLKRRAESDKKTLLQVLHAFGYYEGQIEITYLGAFPDTTVRLCFDLGPLYTFNTLSVIDEEGEPLCFDPCDLALQPGCPARSDVVLDTQDQILDEIGHLGYPFASMSDREVVVDQASKCVDVTYVVSPGPLAYFGPITVEGLCKTRRRFITRQILWNEGELFNPDLVTCTDAKLQESGLFSFVTVRPGQEVDACGYLPMNIRLDEKKYRHIGAGVSYSTDESAGAMAQWSHENLTGWSDTLAFTGEYSEIIKRATIFYAMPDFFRYNHDLLLSAEARREDAPGFIERELSFLARISHRVNEVFSYNYGGRYERLLSTKSDNDDNYHLISAPIQIRYDTSNRLLDPTHGTTIAYFGTPYKALFNQHIFFYRQELFAATYHSIFRDGAVMIALFGQLGSITGQSRFVVPAPKRFYAGSSTALRGYKYLTVSPLNGRKPIGGRSLMIGSIEPRVRIFDKLYGAVFYDIGNVYETPFPILSRKLLRSTGVGIRYLTAVGPFRLDIGFPLDKRKGIDKSFQIYASIGQTW